MNTKLNYGPKIISPQPPAIKSGYTTLAILFEKAIKEKGDLLLDLVYSVDDNLVNEQFENGYGSDLEKEKYVNVHCWTKYHVYTTVIFDGKVMTVVAPRNPPPKKDE